MVNSGVSNPYLLSIAGPARRNLPFAEQDLVGPLSPREVVRDFKDLVCNRNQVDQEIMKVVTYLSWQEGCSS